MISSLWTAIIVVTFFTIIVTESCPLWLKRLMSRYALINLIMNFVISFLIAHFLGTGMIAGTSNLAASVVGAIWILALWPSRYATKQKSPTP